MKRDLSLLPLYPTIVLAGIVMISLGPLLDSLLHDTGLQRAQGGYFSLAFFLCMNLSILGLNFLFGGLSTRATLLLGTSIQAFGLALFGGWAESLTELLACYGLVGFGYGILVVFPGMYISSTIKVGTEKAMSFTYGLFGFGVLMAPAIIGRLLEHSFTWRSVIIGEAVLSAIIFAFLIAAPCKDIDGRKNAGWTDVKIVWKTNPKLWLFMLCATMMYVGAEGMFNVWLAKFHIDVFNASDWRAGLLVTLFWFGITLGRWVSIGLMEKVRPAQILLYGCGAMGFSVLITALIPIQIVSEIFCFGAGFSASVVFPIISAYAGRFPKWHSGLVFASGIFAAGIGSTVLPYLVGPLADIIGFRPAIATAVFPVILVAVFSLLAEKASKRPAYSSSQ